MKATTRSLRLMSALLMFAVLLAACGSTTSTGGATTFAPSVASGGATAGSGSTASAGGTAESVATTGSEATASGNAAASGWTGTITMYAQGYTPNKPEATRPLKAFEEVAAEYERTHPGINIEFITEDFQSWNDTVRVKAAAGELYDIFWAQWGSLNGTLPKGVAVDLAPYFTQKNPYVADAATWQDAMNPTIIGETAAPGGAKYNINGDFVATAFFYNTGILDKAGITATPTTWPELLAASQKLKDAGVPAAVGVPLFSWWSRLFLSDFYANDYDRIAGFDQSPGISALDEAVAINKGILSTQDERFLGWWPIFKQFTDFWIQDYLARPTEENTAARQDFIGGKAAMLYEGSYFANDLRDANLPFEYATFNFPTLSKDITPLSTGTNTANAVGGPNAAYQYAMSTPQSNKTMQEPGKTEAVLDWLRYIGTPVTAEKIINENGSFIPTFAGTKGKPELAILSEQSQQKLRTVRLGSASPQLDSDMQRLFGLYLSGASTLEEITPQVQQALDRASQDYITKEKVDLSKYQ